MASGITELIDQLSASLTEAKSFPLSADKCIFDRTSALELLDEIKEKLPAEITEAKRLLNGKSEVIRKAREDADRILREASEAAAAMMEKESIVLAAKKRAQEIVADTQKKCSELCRGASAYADDKLRQSEESMGLALEELRKKRADFRTMTGYKD